MTQPSSRGRWVAVITGAISIVIAVAYLALITVLDARGPLLPPPPEALGLAGSSAALAEVAAAAASFASAPPRG